MCGHDFGVLNDIDSPASLTISYISLFVSFYAFFSLIPQESIDCEEE